MKVAIFDHSAPSRLHANTGALQAIHHSQCSASNRIIPCLPIAGIAHAVVGGPHCLPCFLRKPVKDPPANSCSKTLTPTTSQGPSMAALR